MEESLKTDLDYVSGKTLLAKGSFGISPSGINNFVTKPHEWYREHVLDQKAFTGNTASVLGTICHYCAEMYIKNRQITPSNIEQIHNYIYKECVLIKDNKRWFDLTAYIAPEDIEAKELKWVDYLNENCNNPDIDGRIILEQWRPMVTTMINHIIQMGIPSNSEDMIKAEVMPGYWASGSADAYDKDTKTLIDFKTTSDKTPKKYIPMNYKYQLLTYAWIYNQLGIPVETIKIVWVTRQEIGRISEKTGKPMKDYPSVAGEAIEVVGESDMYFIESLLKLISESVAKTKEDPSLTHIIWKDYRLKPDEGQSRLAKSAIPDWANKE